MCRKDDSPQHSWVSLNSEARGWEHTISRQNPMVWWVSCVISFLIVFFASGPTGFDFNREGGIHPNHLNLWRVCALPIPSFFSDLSKPTYEVNAPQEQTWLNGSAGFDEPNSFHKSDLALHTHAAWGIPNYRIWHVHRTKFICNATGFSCYPPKSTPFVLFAWCWASKFQIISLIMVLFYQSSSTVYEALSNQINGYKPSPTDLYIPVLIAHKLLQLSSTINDSHC